jgi:hypothetical protein
VGGEHRRHIAVGQRLRNRFAAQCRPSAGATGHFHAAFLGVARALVHGAAADVVAVFGQIGQVLK